MKLTVKYIVLETKQPIWTVELQGDAPTTPALPDVGDLVSFANNLKRHRLGKVVARHFSHKAPEGSSRGDDAQLTVEIYISDASTDENNIAVPS